MWFAKNAPIRRKLRIIMMVTCSVALLTACVALFFFQLLIFRRTFQRDLMALAQIVSTNTTAAVTFKDSEAAGEILASLVAKPQIKGAMILSQDGAILARFGNGDRHEAHPMDKAAFYFDGHELVYINPIIMDKKQIGTLGLYSDYEAEFARLLELYLAILAGVVVGSILIASRISAGLQRGITQPILDLAETARIVAGRKDYSVRARKIENDEIGLLTDAFNQMLAQIQVQDSELLAARGKLELQVKALSHQILERQRAESQLEGLHGQLLEASRQAGRAEVATGVLHNVGNVLNSVNVSTTLLLESAIHSKIPNLSKAVALLNQQGENLAEFLAHDPRGKILPGYLAEVSEHLVSERTAMQQEVEVLAKNVQHIRDIVAMQQTYAKVSGFLEPLSIEALVEDAIQMNLAALNLHSIEIIRQYQKVPLVMLDKHKVLQILINLIQNAKNALAEKAGDGVRTLLIGIATRAGAFVQITITDTGIGIMPENLTRVFAHGFTTRANGHGFGLHSGAIAAKEMGGSLIAFSRGIGFGAEFTLEIPLAIPPL